MAVRGSAAVGRLTRQREELNDFWEAIAFDLCDVSDYVEHTVAVEREAQAEVTAASHRLRDSEERHERVRAEVEAIRRVLPADGSAGEEHLDRLELIGAEVFGEVLSAQRHLRSAQQRLERIRAQLHEIKRHVLQDRRAALDFARRNGFGHRLRPEVAASVDGALAVLIARTAANT